MSASSPITVQSKSNRRTNLPKPKSAQPKRGQVNESEIRFWNDEADLSERMARCVEAYGWQQLNPDNAELQRHVRLTLAANITELTALVEPS